MSDVDADALDDLKLAAILEKDAEVPTFGHSTRR